MAEVPEAEVGALAGLERAAEAASPSARAASRVTAAKPSSADRPNCARASASARLSEVHGEVPGFKSVATAIGTPWARSAASGGRCVSPSIRNAPGSSTATVPLAASAATPASEVYSTWSADSAPNSAASAAPPESDSWSACTLTASP